MDDDKVIYKDQELFTDVLNAISLSFGNLTTSHRSKHDFLGMDKKVYEDIKEQVLGTIDLVQISPIAIKNHQITTKKNKTLSIPLFKSCYTVIIIPSPIHHLLYHTSALGCQYQLKILRISWLVYSVSLNRL